MYRERKTEKKKPSSPSVFKRVKVKKRIIVGNTSMYIPEGNGIGNENLILLERREAHDTYTHKWMVYVRGPKEVTSIVFSMELTI